MNPIHFTDLGISPIALDLGLLQIRWYSLAYIGGILIGWWYLLKLLAVPGAPMARRHADDMVFYATLGPVYSVIKRVAPGAATNTENVGLAMLEAARGGADKRVLENADINGLAARRAR